MFGGKDCGTGSGGWGLMAIFFILIIGVFAWAITARRGDGYGCGYPAAPAPCGPGYGYGYGGGCGVPPYAAYEAQHISEQFGCVKGEICASNASLSKQIDKAELAGLLESKNAQIAEWQNKYNSEHQDKLQQQTLNAVAAGDCRLENMIQALGCRLPHIPPFLVDGGFAQAQHCHDNHGHRGFGNDCGNRGFERNFCNC